RALPTTLDGNHAGGRWWGARAGFAAFGDGRLGLGRRGLDELLDEVRADAVVLDAALQLRRLGAGLLEVEDDGGAGEGQLVAVLDGSKEEASLLGRGFGDDTVSLCTLEVELEQGDHLAALHEPIRTVDWRARGVEVVRQHLLALSDL